jgi:pyridoxamine 5'-phosphate oxidase
LTRLDRATAPGDPVALFGRWLADATEAGTREPTAMALATAAADGRPSSRMVLLKDFGPGGFVFATSYRSRKARELEANPWASLLFYWNALDRQVRIEGRVERAEPALSDDIFARRPREARIGAIVSRQSEVLPDRSLLERAYADFERELGGGDPPRPAHWGGYRVLHDAVEFWAGRPHRLHDRLRYVRAADSGWTVERLWP